MFRGKGVLPVHCRSVTASVAVMVSRRSMATPAPPPGRKSDNDGVPLAPPSSSSPSPADDAEPTLAEHMKKAESRINEDQKRKKKSPGGALYNPEDVYPGSTSLEPYQRPKGPKWSFLASPSDRSLISPDYHTNSVVPNNEAKPKLPMWSSSLTSPKLDKVKLKHDTWIAPHLTAGFLPDDEVEVFVKWLMKTADAVEGIDGSTASPTTGDAAATMVGRSSYLSFALRHLVELKLRAGDSCRGLFAKQRFEPGDVILALPAATCSPPPSSSSSSNTDCLAWGLQLNSDTLRRFSKHAAARGVPSYSAVRDIVSKRKSSFDPIPHPLFIDQVYFALFLACEKAAGDQSPLYPYLRLLPDPAIDNEAVLDMYRGIIDPISHLEYTEHRNRMRQYCIKIDELWTGASKDGGAGAVGGSPGYETIEWALRIILGRQLLVPEFRRSGDMVDLLKKVSTTDQVLNEENFWQRNITKARRWWLRHVFRVIDEERMKVNDFDPATVATVCPLFDMIQHDPKGGNVVWMIDEEEAARQKEAAAAAAAAAGGAATEDDKARVVPPLLLVAAKPIAEGEELTRSFSRCYSTSYTLYRYGFLALRDREVDRREDLIQAGVDPKTIGWENDPTVSGRLLADSGSGGGGNTKKTRLGVIRMLSPSPPPPAAAPASASASAAAASVDDKREDAASKP